MLLFEELRYKLPLNFIQLPQRCLQRRPVFIGSFAEDVPETNGGALHEQFWIFFARRTRFAVASEIWQAPTLVR
jgi:hypothetical protein